MRLACALLLVAACGTTNDDRPLTIQYVTEGVLAPTCGGAECHSAFSSQRGDVFDTVEAARRSLVDNGLVSFDSVQYDPADPAHSALITWITQIDPFGLGIGRMPYDAPMPNADVQYLEDWIKAGAPGAQCDPDLAGGMACNNNKLVRCKPDWNFGETVMTCPMGCVSGGCLQ